MATIGVGALCQRAGLADDRHEVAGLVQFGKKLQARFARLLARLAATGDMPAAMNGQNRLVGGARITGQRDLSWRIPASEGQPSRPERS